MHYVCILLSVVVVKQWSLYQLDIKNAFLNENLQKKVYMLQSPDYEVQGDEHGLQTQKSNLRFE